MYKGKACCGLPVTLHVLGPLALPAGFFFAAEKVISAYLHLPFIIGITWWKPRLVFRFAYMIYHILYERPLALG
jgi:hypothetical protein